MSLQVSALLAPRATIETWHSSFETTLENIDTNRIFEDIIGLETQKRVLLDAILAQDPVHHLIIGPPGNGKSQLLKCIEKTFPNESLFIDSTMSTGIGMIERILDKGHSLRFLLVDEIEKFDKNDREVFLGLLEGGNISRQLKEYSRKISGLKVFLFATCNDIMLMHRKERPLLNRCDIIEVPELDFGTFLHVAGKRLLKENGIHSEEMGRFIAGRVFHDLGKEKDIRKCIRLARKSYARAILTREDDTITKDVIDEVVADNKQIRFKV